MVEHVGLGHRRDETISPARDGLYETWPFRIVLQDFPDLADRTVDAVVGVEEYALAPDSLDDVLSTDDLSSLFHQDHKNFHRDALQLELTTGATELIGAEIELEVLPKSKRARHSGWF